MPKISAGLLMFRRRDAPELFLVHPGGPFWAKKDRGAWSIPKGEVAEGEDLLAAARREFEEETSFVPLGPFLPLPPVRQKAGKEVHAWAFEGDHDPARLVSNLSIIHWPPGSGKTMEIPEIDRGGYFSPQEAREKLNPAQAEWVDALIDVLGAC
ncbi:MAG: NUDIX domain-containing protein [Acidobacteriota bacterium]|nr:NUDIX domain-containing protein [Acidobacteriota bacterium]